jgi:recombination protein RecA
MFGNPETTTGGNALKFYSSIRIDIRRSSQIKEGEDVIGNNIKVKVVKNKVAPPFKKAEFDIMYGEGISKVGEILDLAVELNLIKKSGSWFSYGETKLGQGRDAVKQIIKDNKELMNELEQKIKEALAKTEIQETVEQD